MLGNIIRWFKFKIVIPLYNGRNSRYLHDDYGACNYGNGNSSLSNIQIPKTSAEVTSRKFFSEQKRQDLDHFKTLNNRVFKPVLRYNESVRDKIFHGHEYYDWHSFKLEFNISHIRSVDVYENALNHITIELPSFSGDISQLESKIDKLNELVENTKTKIENKMRDELKEFRLAENGSFVLTKLKEYWFDINLRKYKVDRKCYREIFGNLTSIDDDKLHESEGYLKYGASSFVEMPTNRDTFVQKFMELVKDYEIWDSILDLENVKRLET
jgi:hypothetical protein